MAFIVISVVYCQHFVDTGCCLKRFVHMAQAPGMTDARAPHDFIPALMKLQQDCCVGTTTTILPGVTVGKNVMIAARSVVTRDAAPDTIVDGNPAKLIKSI